MAEQLKLDTQAFMRGMNDIQRRQVPFVIAKTLTDAARRGQDLVRERTRDEFDLHTEFIPKQIFIKPAKARDAKIGAAFSQVYTSDKIGFMGVHELGGVREPNQRALAIPTTNALNIPSFKSASGKVRSRFKPAKLLHRERNPGYSLSGVLLARMKKKDTSAVAMYVFKDEAHYQAVWEFDKTVRIMIQSGWMVPVFYRNMKTALASARR